jgi:hypothetical protein
MNNQTNKFTVQSRYGEPRTIEKIDDQTYTLSGKSHFCRGGEGMVDLEGGPFLKVGYDFYELGIITEVKFLPTDKEGFAKIKVVVNDKDNSQDKARKW